MQTSYDLAQVKHNPTQANRQPQTANRKPQTANDIHKLQNASSQADYQIAFTCNSAHVVAAKVMMIMMMMLLMMMMMMIMLMMMLIFNMKCNIHLGEGRWLADGMSQQ